MNTRQIRLAETFEAIGGPIARLARSLQDDGASIAKPETEKSDYDLLATDAFLQRFQQLTDLALRKLFPRMLAVLEQSDVRHPFAAVFDRLDGYEVLSDVSWWVALNETRNRLIHEYAMSADDRAGEIARAWTAAGRLHAELIRIREDRDLGRRLLNDD